MSWNRKYRPQQIKDLHLKSVRDYFLNLMNNGSFPQVFLFAGPKGTGKTSTARIIGALLNDPHNITQVEDIFVHKKNHTKPLSEPSDSFQQYRSIFSGQSYLVQELDAASNRGIDDIRALKDRVQLPPVDGTVAVYILDEVHMLTTEAFNALLKLLEEPPSHVVFILATTELQKVPETVLSRCQLISFHQASQEELLDAVTKVSSKEKLQLPDETINLISSKAGGSFRDAIKMLEQVAQTGKTGLSDVEQLLGMNYQQEIFSLLDELLHKNAQKIVALFQDMRAKGLSEQAFHKDLIRELHAQLQIGVGLISGKAIIQPEVARFLLTELSGSELSQGSMLPFLRMELKFLELVERANKKNSNVPPPTSGHSSATTQRIIKTSTKSKKELADKITATEVTAPADTIAVASFSDNLSGNGQLLCQQWPDFVKQVSQTNFSLGTLLKAAKPISGDTGELTLNVYYRFHQEQLQQPKFNQILNSLIAAEYGGSVRINCILADNPPEAELTDTNVDQQLEKLAVDVLM